MLTPITPGSTPPPGGPYTPGIVVGNLLFCAGQGPFDKDGTFVGETFEDQVHQTMRNLQAVAEAAGTSLENTVRMGAYLSTLNYFDRFNAVVREYLTQPFPARTTIPVDLRGFDIEIDMVIAIPE